MIGNDRFSLSMILIKNLEEIIMENYGKLII